MLLFQLARVSSIDKWSSFYKGKKFHKFTPNRMRPKPSSHYRDIGDGKPPPRLNTGSEDVGGGEIPENFDDIFQSLDIEPSIDKEELPLLCPHCKDPYIPGMPMLSINTCIVMLSFIHYL